MTAGASLSVIRIQDLTKYYGSRLGVSRLNLDVPAGTRLGFLGPNGAGKTTTIRVLLGFLRPSSGKAQTFDLDCWKQSHLIKRRVGYLPGDVRFYTALTGQQTLDLFSRVRGLDLTARGDQLARQLDLDMGVRVRNMSRGMRQKLALVVTLAPEPELLVLDEPSSGLDPLMQQFLNNHLRDLAGRGHTVFFSSHTLSEVEQVCTRVAILREGTLVADESIESLRAKALRRVTIRFRGAAPEEQASLGALLNIESREASIWRCRLCGSIRDLLSWLASHAVEDVEIGQPDLEGLFRGFYSAQETAP